MKARHSGQRGRRAVAVTAWALAMAAVMAQDQGRSVQPQPAAAAVVPVQEQRLALVIGINAYQTAPLVNPVNDAKAIAQALRATGFKVTLRTDIGHRDFLLALRQFGDALRSGGVGVFYYAGHGMQIKGRNYLIPVDAVIEREDEVAYAAVDAQAVLDKMETAGNSTNLMILDACRNNPFARSFRSSSQGLAQMDAPVGTLVAFATAPGAVASDGQGSNGLYTQHLLRAMSKPGLKVEDVFKQTRSAVRAESQGKQIPWESTSLEGDFYFVPTLSVPATPASPPPLDTARAVEDAFWASVKDTRDPAELRAFLNRYPQGTNAALARERLAALQPPPARPQPAPPVAVAPASQPVTVALPAPSRPATARSNAQGYAVGDKWNYQVVDHYRKEVARNYSWQVNRLLPDGTWYSGATQFDEAGRPQKFPVADGRTRELVPYGVRWWPDMKIGDSRRMEYEVKTTGPDGTLLWVNRVKAQTKAVRRENVRVPAGSFDAVRVEVSGDTSAVGRQGYGSFSYVYWYAPELHTMISAELSSLWNGRRDEYERHELTSLRLVNHPDYR